MKFRSRDYYEHVHHSLEQRLGHFIEEDDARRIAEGILEEIVEDTTKKHCATPSKKALKWTTREALLRIPYTLAVVYGSINAYIILPDNAPTAFTIAAALTCAVSTLCFLQDYMTSYKRYKKSVSDSNDMCNDITRDLNKLAEKSGSSKRELVTPYSTFMGINKKIIYYIFTGKIPGYDNKEYDDECKQAETSHVHELVENEDKYDKEMAKIIIKRGLKRGAIALLAQSPIGVGIAVLDSLLSYPKIKKEIYYRWKVYQGIRRAAEEYKAAA
jgi:hypothetical protein